MFFFRLKSRTHVRYKFKLYVFAGKLRILWQQKCEEIQIFFKKNQKRIECRFWWKIFDMKKKIIHTHTVTLLLWNICVSRKMRWEKIAPNEILLFRWFQCIRNDFRVRTFQLFKINWHLNKRDVSYLAYQRRVLPILYTFWWKMLSRVACANVCVCVSAFVCSLFSVHRHTECVYQGVYG